MRKILGKKVKGVPLLAIVLISTTILAVSAVWFTYQFTNLLTIDGDDPYTTYEETSNFDIIDEFIPPDILFLETKLTGSKEVTGEFDVEAILTLTDPSYTLEGGYIVSITILDPLSNIVCQFNNVDQTVTTPELNGGSPIFTLSNLNPLVTTETGTHEVTVTISGMSWITP